MNKRLIMNLHNKILRHGQDVLSQDQKDFILRTGKLTWVV